MDKVKRRHAPNVVHSIGVGEGLASGARKRTSTVNLKNEQVDKLGGETRIPSLPSRIPTAAASATGSNRLSKAATAGNLGRAQDAASKAASALRSVDVPIKPSRIPRFNSTPAPSTEARLSKAAATVRNRPGQLRRAQTSVTKAVPASTPAAAAAKGVARAAKPSEKGKAEDAAPQPSQEAIGTAIDRSTDQPDAAASRPAVVAGGLGGMQQGGSVQQGVAVGASSCVVISPWAVPQQNLHNVSMAPIQSPLELHGAASSLLPKRGPYIPQGHASSRKSALPSFTPTTHISASPTHVASTAALAATPVMAPSPAGPTMGATHMPTTAQRLPGPTSSAPPPPPHSSSYTPSPTPAAAPVRQGGASYSPSPYISSAAGETWASRSVLPPMSSFPPHIPPPHLSLIPNITPNPSALNPPAAPPAPPSNIPSPALQPIPLPIAGPPTNVPNPHTTPSARPSSSRPPSSRPPSSRPPSSRPRSSSRPTSASSFKTMSVAASGPSDLPPYPQNSTATEPIPSAHLWLDLSDGELLESSSEFGKSGDIRNLLVQASEEDLGVGTLGWDDVASKVEASLAAVAADVVAAVEANEAESSPSPSRPSSTKTPSQHGDTPSRSMAPRASVPGVPASTSATPTKPVSGPVLSDQPPSVISPSLARPKRSSIPPIAAPQIFTDITSPRRPQSSKHSSVNGGSDISSPVTTSPQLPRSLHRPAVEALRLALPSSSGRRTTLLQSSQWNATEIKESSEMLQDVIRRSLPHSGRAALEAANRANLDPAGVDSPWKSQKFSHKYSHSHNSNTVSPPSAELSPQPHRRSHGQISTVSGISHNSGISGASAPPHSFSHGPHAASPFPKPAPSSVSYTDGMGPNPADLANLHEAIRRALPCSGRAALQQQQSIHSTKSSRPTSRQSHRSNPSTRTSKARSPFPVLAHSFSSSLQTSLEEAIHTAPLRRAASCASPPPSIASSSRSSSLAHGNPLRAALRTNFSDTPHYSHHSSRTAPSRAVSAAVAASRHARNAAAQAVRGNHTAATSGASYRARARAAATSTSTTASGASHYGSYAASYAASVQPSEGSDGSRHMSALAGCDVVSTTSASTSDMVSTHRPPSPGSVRRAVRKRASQRIAAQLHSSATGTGTMSELSDVSQYSGTAQHSGTEPASSMHYGKLGMDQIAQIERLHRIERDLSNKSLPLPVWTTGSSGSGASSNSSPLIPSLHPSLMSSLSARAIAAAARQQAALKAAMANSTLVMEGGRDKVKIESSVEGGASTSARGPLQTIPSVKTYLRELEKEGSIGAPDPALVSPREVPGRGKEKSGKPGLLESIREKFRLGRTSSSTSAPAVVSRGGRHSSSQLASPVCSSMGHEVRSSRLGRGSRSSIASPRSSIASPREIRQYAAGAGVRGSRSVHRGKDAVGNVPAKKVPRRGLFSLFGCGISARVQEQGGLFSCTAPRVKGEE